MTDRKKTLEYYRLLPYKIFVEPRMDSDGTYYWVAEYPDLRGCKTEGVSKAEAIANVQQLFDEYVTARLEVDENIPEPQRSPAPRPRPLVAWLIPPTAPTARVEIPEEEGSAVTAGHYSEVPA
ncbi:MAG: type II toxin-antitoxin system HicB family antitoxin [Bacteroidota bacterium]